METLDKNCDFGATISDESRFQACCFSWIPGSQPKSGILNQLQPVSACLQTNPGPGSSCIGESRTRIRMRGSDLQPKHDDGCESAGRQIGLRASIVASRHSAPVLQPGKAVLDFMMPLVEPFVVANRLLPSFRRKQLDSQDIRYRQENCRLPEYRVFGDGERQRRDGPPRHLATA